MRKYMLALVAFLTPVLLSLPAYASDGGFAGDRDGPVGGGRYSIERVTTAMDDLVDVMEQVWTIMVSNPLLLVFLAAGLFALGVRIFKKVKGAARG